MKISKSSLVYLVFLALTFSVSYSASYLYTKFSYFYPSAISSVNQFVLDYISSHDEFEYIYVISMDENEDYSNVLFKLIQDKSVKYAKDIKFYNENDFYKTELYKSKQVRDSVVALRLEVKTSLPNTAFMVLLGSDNASYFDGALIKVIHHKDTGKFYFIKTPFIVTYS